MEGRIWPIVGILLLTASGCLGPFARHSARDGDKDLDLPILAGVIDSERERTFNSGVLQVSGVGLVTGLSGTGDSPKGPWRDMLEKELRKQKVEHVRQLLDSPDNAIVLVTALLHGGMRRHDRIDVEVTLPPGSRASSLRGGTLLNCPLRDYQAVRGNPGDLATAERVILAGDVHAWAGGPLLAGLDNPTAAADLKRARIWEGGILQTDRPFCLVMKRDDKSARNAVAVAERLNGLFRDSAGTNDVARPTSAELVALNVPFIYTLNPERFLRVARLVPLRPTSEQTGYTDKLAGMLLDPKTTQRAALRLEALGPAELSSKLSSTWSILKSGLASPHPLVRFAAAESLTYLGGTEGVDELGRLARQERQMRFWALLALASLNESACRNCLADLLAAPEADLRYGAFVALRLMGRNEGAGADGYVAGEKLGTFWLHCVASGSAPLVHISLQKRAEIVLFGNGIRLRPESAVAAGAEFTIRTAAGADQCLVSRVPLAQESQQRQCSPQLDDILIRMAELGAQYPDVVDFLRKADQRGYLSCPLRMDALPEQVEVDALAPTGSR